MKRILIFFIGSLTILSTNSCVQETFKRKVVFTVDARNLENIESISIRGNFQPLNWNENFQLVDDDGDSIYSARIVFLSPYEYLEFKFVKNEDVFELNGKDNRKLEFKDREEMEYKAVFDEE